MVFVPIYFDYITKKYITSVNGTTSMYLHKTYQQKKLLIQNGQHSTFCNQGRESAEFSELTKNKIVFL